MHGTNITNTTRIPSITASEVHNGESIGEQRLLASITGDTPNTAPRSFCSLLQDGVRTNPRGTALTSLYQPPDLLSAVMDQTFASQAKLSWTYEQLDQASDLLASCLYSKGLRKEHSIVVTLYSGAEFSLAMWACAKLGATFAPIDPRSISNANEMAHYLRVLAPAALVVSDDQMMQILQQNHNRELQSIKVALVAEQSSKPLCPPWQQLGDFLNRIRPFEVCASLCAISVIQRAIDVHNDVALIIFTSGTSGLPKACPHTHKSIYATYYSGYNVQAAHPSFATIHHMPPSHIFAILTLIRFWQAGARIIVPDRMFNPTTTIAAIHNEHGTHVPAVPSLLTALVTHPLFDKSKMASVRNVLMGGAAVSLTTIATAQESFPNGSIVVGYGMSEGSPALLCGHRGSVISRDGHACVGRATAGARVKICSPTSDEALFRDETGELHLGGDMIIEAYAHGDNGAFYIDGKGQKWIRTGDQALMDHSGAVYILGRYKDLIIRGGENLAPAAIEASLNKIPGVTAQVVGVADSIAGELPIALIQLHEGHSTLPVEQMRATVVRDLGEIHAPASYLLLSDLGLAQFPVTTSGKVRKFELRGLVEDYFKRRTLDELVPALAEEDKLCKMLAFLLGQTPESLPRDKPLQELADSINLLRLVDHIKRKSSKEIGIQDVLKSTSIQDLARRLGKLEAVNRPDEPVDKEGRKGPPMASDMIHTHGEMGRADITRESTEAVLAPMGMCWDNDVEDVFPVCGIALKHLANTRKYGATNRLALITRTANVVNIRQAIRKSLKHWPIFRTITVQFDESLRLYVVLRLDSAWANLALIDHEDVESIEELR
ncbi:MAG: hypothetical protein Q9174_005433, partial [Haloplaca sp. 1 TL-2023]